MADGDYTIEDLDKLIKTNQKVQDAFKALWTSYIGLSEYLNEEIDNAMKDIIYNTERKKTVADVKEKLGL